MDVCPACATNVTHDPFGVCLPCRDRLRFVVRPEAHREMYRRGIAAERSRADRTPGGPVIVSSLPSDNSLWICDACNSRIPITGEFTLIPLLGSYALCHSCVSLLAYWPDGWTYPTPRACRCGPCQRPLLRILTRT
jgi:hypothetical protein